MSDQDPDQGSVYGAEESARDRFTGWGVLHPDLYIASSEVHPFALTTLAVLAHEGNLPKFEMDVQDSDGRAGWYDNNAIVIHLHPNRITRWVVLHEMAHWLDPGSQIAVTHGPQFRAAHVALVRAAFGQDAPFGEDSAADVFAAAYLAAGVPISAGGEMTP